MSKMVHIKEIAELRSASRCAGPKGTPMCCTRDFAHHHETLHMYYGTFSEITIRAPTLEPTEDIAKWELAIVLPL